METAAAIATAVTAITTQVGKIQDAKDDPAMKQQLEALAVIEFQAKLARAIITANLNPTPANEAAVQALLGV